MSSAVYLMNDIVDLNIDRLHPTKYLRPLAAGKVTVRQTKVTAIILGSLSISLAFILDFYFGVALIIYCLFNILYSNVFKNVVIIDVFCLAFFFYLRIIAGSITANVVLSHWIILMTILMSLFLGFNKRRQELQMIDKESDYYRIVLTHYNLRFLDQVVTVIAFSIVVVYTLYTINARTVKEFGTVHLMYTIPFVCYGIFRYLYLMRNLNQEGNPTDVLFSDIKLMANLSLWGIVSVAVIYFKL